MPTDDIKSASDLIDIPKTNVQDTIVCVLTATDQYQRGEIDTDEFCERRDALRRCRTDTPNYCCTAVLTLWRSDSNIILERQKTNSLPFLHM